MPTSSLTGKSKDDLATIAAVSGLLSREQALAMTKPELLKFLKNAESTAKSETQVPAATRKGQGRKKSVQQVAATEAGKTAEPVVTVAEKAPPLAEPVAESVEVSLDAAATVKTRKPRRKLASDKVVVPAPVETAPPDSQDDSQTTPEPEPLAVPERTAVPAPAPGKRSAGADTAGPKPVRGKGQFPDRYPAKNQASGRNQDHKQTRQTGKRKAPADASADTKRPMRVKVFGIPANPLAGQDADMEPSSTPLPEVPVESRRIPAGAASAPVHESRPVHQLTSVPDHAGAQSIPAVQPALKLAPAAPAEPSETEDLALDQTFPEKELATGSAGEKFNRKQQIESGDSITGVLEIMPDGYGFLRRDNYLQGAKDAYVPPQYIRRFGLRPGDLITGPCKKQRDNDRYQALLYIKEVNGQTPDKMIRRPHFDRLTPIYPDERYVLETVRNELSTRIIDLVAPIGKGQRGMIVSPPKAGKTILLQKIANAISTNNPDVKLIVLLIDERPEEVTDMQRSINGEVVFSTFDKTPENHVKVTELVLERAMRLVELKQDVVILLDSMTRLARAYNLTITPTGRTLSGGLDPGALYGPKRFFGAARNIENGGSLTIIATSLIETGSRMDEVIFEEFKGTGNMEVYLDRKLSEKRIFPAIDINRSGTRREELLLSDKELDAVWTIRKAFGQLDTAAVTETIINLLLKTQTNQQFISSINVSFNDKNVFDAMRGTRPSQTNGNASSSGGPGNNRRTYDRDND
ncbi:MAG: transcription termination factor Rho [Eubacteriales bacterium]|nr:transcription termination factor Rho [Eubacteriales bacterium]